MKSFYSHLIQIDFLHQELDSLHLTKEEKDELLKHVHGSIHVTVLDVILSELPEEHKKTFLEHFQNNQHEELWKHVLENTVGIEEKIRIKVIALAKDFAQDVRIVREKQETIDK